jgi:hypothetical protein
MDMNVYVAEWLIKERIAEARAAGARSALLDAHRPPRQPMRVALGLALIRLGQRIQSGRPSVADPLGAGNS